MKPYNTISTMLALGVLAISAAAPAAAFDVEEKLQIQGEKLEKYAAEKGLVLTKVMSKDRSLGEGGADTVKLDDLRSIYNYVAIGVCDSDCDGVGLTVRRTVGIDDPEILTEDVSGTATPVVEFFVAPFSPHEMTISMMSCSTFICGYGVDIYRTEKIE